MQKLTPAQVSRALAQHANNNVVSAQQVQELLGNASVTFAQITYVTEVQLAAAHKSQRILKVTTANVLLCSNIKAHTHVYQRAVRKNAAQYVQNDVAAVQQFEAQSNYFMHTDCYSVVAHKQHTHKQYLYAIYNTASSVYTHNGEVVSKEYVAEFCTPSARKQLLCPDAVVHNKTHNIVHNVRVRTIALDNIVQMRARKQLLSV